MAKKKKQELAKREETEAPAYIDKGEEGLENMTGEDLIIPRLVIMQAMSPAVEEGEHQKGEVINSLTDEVWIGIDEVEPFIPIYHFKEWIQWAPRDSGGGIVDRSMDPSSELAMSAKRGEKDEEGNRLVTEYHNFISVLRSQGFKKPCIIACAKSNHKHGRKLLGLAKYRGNYPLYAGLYDMAAVKEENKQGQKYFAWKFENAGWVDEEELEEAKAMYGVLAGMKWKDGGPQPEDEGEEEESDV